MNDSDTYRDTYTVAVNFRVKADTYAQAVRISQEIEVFVDNPRMYSKPIAVISTETLDPERCGP